jgi:tetratricopeptide (TPR) repeat protein
LELVLEHELAHIRRRDFWTEVLARAATALLWFHPAAWAALKNLRRERELACDDAVLDLGVKPSDYAAQLLKMAVSAAPLNRKSYPELALSGRGGLQGRLASILDPGRASKQGRRRIGLVLAPAMIVLAGTTALSSFWMEDGRMGMEARQYWQKTGIPNPGVLDFSIEQAQARGGWTAVYARVLESLAGGGVKFQGDQLVSLGARFWFDGKREEARTILRLALKIKPDAARWFKTVGEQLLEAGKMDLADNYLEMAKFLYPETSKEIENILAKKRSR